MITGIIILIIIIVCLIVWLIVANNDAKFYRELFKESQDLNLKIIEKNKQVLKHNDRILDENKEIVEFDAQLIEEQRKLADYNIQLISFNEKLVKILNNKEETNNDSERVSEGSVENCEQTTEC